VVPVVVSLPKETCVYLPSTYIGVAADTIPAVPITNAKKTN
jgi:hypothetical protein